MMRRAVALAILLACASAHGATPPPARRPRPPVERLPSGVALPYPTRHLFRGFGRCLGNGRHWHEAIDLGGVGPDAGVGTPVRSMVKARIVMIGTGADRPEDFGTPFRGKRGVVRGGRKLPSWRDITGYGDVWFFTAARGRWRSGNIVVTTGLEAPLEGARIRYMHLAAVRPDLEVGDVLEAGEELGLLGGTGVQTASPHVHIDIRDAEDRAVDVAPLLGLAPTARCGEARDRAVVDADDYDGVVDEHLVGPPAPERWPAGPDGDARPPLELEPAPPPWRIPGDGAVPEVATKIDIADCGLFEQVGSGGAAFRAKLFARRFLELAIAGPRTADGQAPASPAFELWDLGHKARLMPGTSTSVAVSEIPAAHGHPAGLRLVVAETTEVAFVIRAAGGGDWHLRIAEKCKRGQVADTPPSAPAPPATP